MKEYTFFARAILRTPIFPIEKISDLDHQELDTAIFRLLQDKIIREAIYFASPELIETYDMYMSSKLPGEKQRAKMIRSLGKYIIRMSSRGTPFGLFAGCSVLKVSDETNVVLGNLEHSRVRTRLDCDFVYNLLKKISLEKRASENLLYYTNNTLYRVGSTMRYYSRHFSKDSFSYSLETFATTPEIDDILSLAIDGSDINTLVECIAESGVSVSEATEFIQQLITAQILIDNLNPFISGDEIQSQIVAKIRSLSKCTGTDELSKDFKSYYKLLSKIDKTLASIDRQTIGNELDAYKSLEDDIANTHIPYKKNFLFQKHLFKPTTQNLLSVDITEQVYEGIEVLLKLCGSSPDNNLTKFKKKFLDKFQYEEVPLSLALDVELGVSYLSDHGYTFDILPAINLKEETFRKKNDASHLAIGNWPLLAFLIKKIDQCHSNGNIDVEISNEDLAGFELNFEHWSDTFYVLISIFKHTQHGNDIISLNHIANGSAAKLISRFCYDDGAILDLLTEITEKEKELQPGKVIAEIVHLPTSRAGNLCNHSCLYDYEIPIYEKSCVDKVNQIPIDDLMVSIQEGKVILRSMKLNKEVIPRLSNSLNPELSKLPVYRFLKDMESPNSGRTISLELPFLQTCYSRIPRIRYKNILLAMETWRLSKLQITAISVGNREENISAFLSLKKDLKLPRFIKLLEQGSDNSLLIDTDINNCILIFIDAVKGKESAAITEFPIDMENAAIKNSQNETFANEVLLFLKKKRLTPSRLPAANELIPSIPLVKRTFAPCDEWLFFKIYIGFKSADTLLFELVSITRNLLENKYIDKWFFVRYADPDYHLRIRVHLTDNGNSTLVLSQINKLLQPYVSKRIVWKVQIDTYDREIERYSHKNIEISESIFYIDSEACIKLLGLKSQSNLDQIWLVALKSMNDYLNLFQLNTEEKIEYLSTSVKSFRSSFDDNVGYRKDINHKYRFYKSTISQWLNDEEIKVPLLSLITPILKNRSKLIAPYFSKLRAKKITVEQLSWLRSYIHMSLNRFFNSQNTIQEFTLYLLLEKYWKDKYEFDQKNKRGF